MHKNAEQNDKFADTEELGWKRRDIKDQNEDKGNKVMSTGFWMT